MTCKWIIILMNDNGVLMENQYQIMTKEINVFNNGKDEFDNNY